MSTFKGYCAEFPNIRIDFFRHQPDLPPAFACFLSHVHSDHLAGLESFRGPFIYCSAATREILLQLKKAAVRLNYARGILEDPNMQTYKHLDKLLKPLPLDTPTTLELQPGHTIQVTLLDANHCVGAVMFLLEGSGKAALYTGDIRCEPRFVTAITQNPNMVAYASGWKTLDRMYLDTSVVSDYPMQSKAEGLKELFDKVQRYPSDTIFHFQAWTYGYEEVWIALSKALNSKIHVDNYKMRVFRSLVTKSKDHRWATQTHLSKEAAALLGFTCGNSFHEGCLTLDENVRIHSCEKGMGCKVMESENVVWIRPIVTHLRDGQDVTEVGIGGGGDDLTQAMTLTSKDLAELLQILSASKELPVELQRCMSLIKSTLISGRDMTIMVDEERPGNTTESMAALLKPMVRKVEAMRNPAKISTNENYDGGLPSVITFPYARHSSLPELRRFVAAFKPKDVVPCTFDADNWIEKGWSIGQLFGDCCSSNDFSYDVIIDQRKLEIATELAEEQSRQTDTQQSRSSVPRESSPIDLPHEEHKETQQPELVTTRTDGLESNNVSVVDLTSSTDLEAPTQSPHKRDSASFTDDAPELQYNSQESAISDHAYATRLRAFEIASANIAGDPWQTIGLISTTDHHTDNEPELGSS
ncbi:hypothetical protein GGR57DRAFT_332999 [Xylariaceae sp. FL1272]|nr:hypothetical protein GGR57DRAFT_332999 [Xylariaceae sp. FL1272]